ncbi:D-aspartate oxidase [Hypsibius exemplaris]|uniref:D-aspartate oxidase n=1 Tax=Hypsibius exemplaris TaxID=2072580 RepID=A0A9X6NHJ7_HYPEX|nr:D-aspartate oxidase [Hypsibius exemplaris]
MSTKIAIVGAGIIGLSTAVCLQDILPEVEVTILADKFHEETTSAVAAGLFRPDHISASDPADVPRWIESSAKRYWSLYRSRDAHLAGIFQISGYVFSNDDPDLPAAKQYRDFVPNYRQLSGRELDDAGGPWRYGCYHSTVLVEPLIHMRYLRREFEKRGGCIQRLTVEDLSVLHGQFGAVVNCSGLGARRLVGDDSMAPVRGQLLRVRAPWLKEFYMGENTTYVYPNSESVVLGGTRESGEWDVTPSKAVSDSIMARCSKMIPAIQDAEIISASVGLRPWRPTVRLETEILQLEGDKTLPVIHNYGHAGNGISLSWGCGVHAAALTQEVLLSSGSVVH